MAQKLVLSAPTMIYSELRDRGNMSLQRYFILKGMLRIRMIILTSGIVRYRWHYLLATCSILVV
jgi:hypothetical protein